MFRRLLLSGLFAAALGAALPASAREVTPSARVSRGVLVRAEASTASAVVARLPKGQTLPVTGEVSGWYEVELPDGSRGYVSKSWTVPTDGQFLAAPRTRSGYRVHVIDVGTGLSVFVEGKDFALLYDAGSQDDLHEGDENRVVAYIRAARPDLRSLDHVILSHPHKDHHQLMPDIFKRYAVKHVWDSGRFHPTDGYCHFLKSVEAEPGVQYHDALAGNAQRTVTFTGSGCKGTIQLRQTAMIDAAPVALGAAARMHFLYRDGVTRGDPNRNTLVVRLDLGTKRILLAGDAEAGEREPPTGPLSPSSIEARLLAGPASELISDVLVAGHHGSLTSSRRPFLDAVGASIYAISSGPYPYRRVRLPDDAIITELDGRGELFRTDRSDEYQLDDEANACELAPRKIGPDADESPGGCDNILIEISGDGAISARYSDLVD